MSKRKSATQRRTIIRLDKPSTVHLAMAEGVAVACLAWLTGAFTVPGGLAGNLLGLALVAWPLVMAAAWAVSSVRSWPQVRRRTAVRAVASRNTFALTSALTCENEATSAELRDPAARRGAGDPVLSGAAVSGDRR